MTPLSARRSGPCEDAASAVRARAPPAPILRDVHATVPPGLQVTRLPLGQPRSDPWTFRAGCRGRVRPWPHVVTLSRAKANTDLVGLHVSKLVKDL